LTLLAKKDGRHLDERVGFGSTTALIRAAIDTIRADTTRPAITGLMAILAQLLLTGCDLPQLLDHQTLTATCLLASVAPFPLVEQAIDDILAESDALCQYVPHGVRFAAFYETLMVLVAEWDGSPQDLVRAVYVLAM
jgi:hypothetical protein